MSRSRRPILSPANPTPCICTAPRSPTLRPFRERRSATNDRSAKRRRNRAARTDHHHRRRRRRRPVFWCDRCRSVPFVLFLSSQATGMIILGGGLVKHHVCNANLMRNGADFSVYVNTGRTIRALRPNHRAAVRPAPRVLRSERRHDGVTPLAVRKDRDARPRVATPSLCATSRRAALLGDGRRAVRSSLARALLRRSSLSRVLLLRLRRKRPRLVMTWCTRVSPCHH